MNKSNKATPRKTVGVEPSRNRKRPGKAAPHPGRAQSRPAATSPKAAVQNGSKIASLLTLLRRPKGANIEELSKATGWQVHSVRGAISGTIKKKLGLTVMSDKVDGARMYRVTN